MSAKVECQPKTPKVPEKKAWFGFNNDQNSPIYPMASERRNNNNINVCVHTVKCFSLAESADRAVG